MKKIKKEKEYFNIYTRASLLLLFIAGIVATVFFVPPNMDEFAHYHIISCLNFPESEFHILRDACGGKNTMNLKVFGKMLPLRSYQYIGFSPSIFYYPIYSLFPDYHSARIMGAITLLFIIFSAAFLTRTNVFLSLAIFGISVPMLFQIVNDTGPVGFQNLLIFLIPLVAKFIVEEKNSNKAFMMSLGLGIITFLGFETKPIMGFYIPSIFIITIFTCCNVYKNPFSLFFIRLLPAFLLFVALTLTLLLSETPYGKYYFQELLGQSGRLSHLSFFEQYLIKIKAVTLDFLPNFYNFAYRYYGFSFSKELYVLSIAFWIPVFYSFIIYYRNFQKGKKEKDKNYYLFIALMLAFIVGFFSSCFDLRKTSGHQIIYLVTFLFTALLIALDWLKKKKPLQFKLILIFLVGVQVVLAAVTFTKEPEDHTSWDRLPILNILAKKEVADRFIIAHIDWGMYFISALYGSKNQLVTYYIPRNDLMAKQFLRLLKNTSVVRNKKLLFVRRTSTNLSVFNVFEEGLKDLRRVYPEPEEKYSSWQIWAEEDLP